MVENRQIASMKFPKRMWVNQPDGYSTCTVKLTRDKDGCIRMVENVQLSRQPWIGLTDEEINAAASVQSWKPFARAIEAKLKEKNT